MSKLHYKLRKKFPDESWLEIDIRVRKILFIRKLLIALFLFVTATTVFLLLEHLEVEDKHSILSSFMKLYGGVASVASVIVFAKSLHEPLTSTEAKELEERETKEKIK